MQNTQKLYEQYCRKMQKIADLRYAAAVLQWDQETYLPPGGQDHRARQIATLSELAHDEFISEETGSIIEKLLSSDNLDDASARNIALSWYDYQKSRKISPKLVRELTETSNQAFHAWIDARKQNNFNIFEEPLQKLIELKKQEVHCLGFEKHPYDALLNEFDRGSNVALLDHLFQNLRQPLHNLLDRIRSRPQVSDQCLKQFFHKQEQWDYGMKLIQEIGFDTKNGRQDLSEHPFTVNFSSRDVRITTRIDEHDFGNMTWSCLHEAGHALYEQGLPDEQYGLPLGEACSLSIHESQSRFWENNIGRSLPFWKIHYQALRAHFPDQFGRVSLETFYHAINRVEPSLIRTEADELTYHFHVMIRYSLEKALIEGSLSAKDIPDAWNQLYHDELGITVPDNIRGCLQDVHWSHGSFGYFSTYSTGSLYAAQWHRAMILENPSWAAFTGPGNFQEILSWLKQHIYRFGRYHLPEDLCRQATGETLNIRHFIDYAERKFSDIYGL